MEIETLELTADDILQQNRGWITKLLIDDKKNEVQIIELLYFERGLAVTLQQIRKCFRDWDLLPIQAHSSPTNPSNQPTPEQEFNLQSLSAPTIPALHIETQSISDTWELVKTTSSSPTRSRLSTTSNLPALPDSPTYTPSPVRAEFDDPEYIHLYKERPLPSLPGNSKRKRKSPNSLDRSQRDKLKLTCHHGAEFHAIEMTLGILDNQGPSPIDTYASDDQSHERIAVGLERNPDRNAEQLPTLPFRNSGQWAGIRSYSRRRSE